MWDPNGIVMTTSNSIDGYTIVSYLGIVSGESVIGTGFFSEALADLADTFGGESRAFSEKIALSKDNALQYMREDASKLGADAIVGIDVEVMVTNANMFVTCVSGTAVKLRSESEDNESADKSGSARNVWVTNYMDSLPVRLEYARIESVNDTDTARIVLFGRKYLQYFDFF